MIPPVVSADWYRDHARSVVLADVRWYLDGRSGQEAYLAGHLPDSRFVDLDRWLSGPATPAAGRNPLPDPEVFAEGMRRLGLADDTALVAYDDASGVIAARLVWMLRTLGHPAALLDGGLTAWDGPTATGCEPEPPYGSFAARSWPADRIADIGDLGDRGSVLLDARNPERYRGDHDPVDPRPGHVPGARNLPCRANVNPDGTFVSRATLRRRFAAVGVASGREVISYCGSGVTACHNLLAMEHAGLEPGRLFPGSWSQYSRTSLPVATQPDVGSSGSDRTGPVTGVPWFSTTENSTT